MWLLAGCGTMLDAQPVASPAMDGAVGITAVSSRVSKDYVRTKLPDGSFQPEEYAFGDGGRYNGPFRDASIDKLSFLDIARVIAASLKAQNYVPAKDLNTEKLLIMLHWGTTITGSSFSATVPGSGPSHLQSDDAIDIMNAAMLGYDSEGLIGTEYGTYIGHFGPTGSYRDQLMAEIEDNRYFVVLMAYDFQVFRKESRHKLLWETRFSINERHNQFDKALPVMTEYASKYFGQDSKGLLRTRVPEGQVKVGEPKSLGEVEAPAK
jgi:hypothetical protein